jgi:invasion protein IalB
LSCIEEFDGVSITNFVVALAALLQENFDRTVIEHLLVVWSAVLFALLCLEFAATLKRKHNAIFLGCTRPERNTSCILSSAIFKQGDSCRETC